MGFQSLVPSLASPEGPLFEPLTMRRFYAVPESIAKNWCAWYSVSLNYLLWFYDKLFWRITYILAFYLLFFYMFSFFLVCTSYKPRDEKAHSIGSHRTLQWGRSWSAFQVLLETPTDLLPILMLYRKVWGKNSKW